MHLSNKLLAALQGTQSNGQTGVLTALWHFVDAWWWLPALALAVGLALRAIMRGSGSDEISSQPILPLEERVEGAAPSVDDLLQGVFDQVVARATEARDWYATKRRPKRTIGFGLRLLVIALTAAAGILPLIPTLFPDAISISVPSTLPSVLLAITALFLALDRFGGYTTGWIRYMLTGQQIDQELARFRVEWAKLQISPNPDVSAHRNELLASLGRFLAAVDGAVRSETNQWAAEFREALQEVERAAKERTEASRTGSLDVEIENRETLTGEWQLLVAGLPSRSVGGSRASVPRVPIGPVTVKAVGKAGGKDVSDEVTAQVQGDQITTVKLMPK